MVAGMNAGNHASSGLGDERTVPHVSFTSNSVQEVLLNYESQLWGGLLFDRY